MYVPEKEKLRVGMLRLMMELTGVHLAELVVLLSSTYPPTNPTSQVKSP